MKWTDEMDAQLISCCGRLKVLADQLGIPLQTLYHRRSELIAAGAVDSARRRWTVDDDALVAGDTPVEQLAEMLGRSMDAIQNWRYVLRRRAAARVTQVVGHQ